MRTGIFAFLASKIVKDSKEPYSFGKEVLEAVKNSKGTTEEEIAGEMKGVLDSMSELKDCEAKDILLNVVKDCFDNREKAVSNEGELTKTLDAMWVDIHGDSLSEIAKAFSKLGAKPKEETKEAGVNDSEDKAKDENKAEDSDDKKKDEEKAEDSDKAKEDSEKDKTDGQKDSDKGKEDKSKEDDGCHGSANKDDILSVIKDSLPEMVKEAVKEVLGLKDGESGVAGYSLDSASKESECNTRDYSSFLE